MRVLEWLENRVANPTDDETRRRQRAFSYIPAASSVFMLLAWAAIFFVAELAALGRIMLAYALVGSIALLLPLLNRRLTAPSVTLWALAAIIANLLAHLVAGGFEGGIWFLMWLVIIPLTIYLTGARREGIVVLVLALLAVSGAVLIDSRLAPPPLIPEWLRLGYDGFVLITSIIMLFLWGVYIFQQLDAARDRADSLLLNILPAPIAAQLKRSPATIANGYNEVTVLFADIVNFTTLSADADPVDVVALLNGIFSEFDDLSARHGLEKIKTIGDAYMVAGGLPVPRPDHCQAVVAFGFDMLAAVKRHTAWDGRPVHLRVGVNTGPVVAGVIGRHKFIYDLWGDAVNTASRMESNGVEDVIQVTAAVKDKLEGQYEFEERPSMYIKGKGQMVTYLIRPRV